MKWRRGHRSAHVEDRRAQGGGRRKLAVGGVTGVIVLLVGAYLGVDVSGLLGKGGSSGSSSQPYKPTAKEQKMFDFVNFVHDDILDTWTKLDRKRFQPAKLVVYRRGTPTAGCGYGKSAIGPFYCPADKTAYIDTSFFQELGRKLGAPGDFAQAYVLAHEIGHHVQNLYGTSAKVRRFKKRASKADGNRESVKLELQADCYAGVWAHSAKKRGLVEIGDIEEALTAAAAIGDDALQKGAGRTVRPESWTHGSSADRQKWFKRGLRSGDPDRCNTFDEM
ncbi:MAG: neutral zinc metallopeptidase [Deltaproteobacteria bacterium]|nr:neutral zinc metallopeptidase [Deltaproteobacteria bacterium]